MNNQEGPILSVGNFTIEVAPGGFGIFVTDDLEDKKWLATAADPEIAMKIVEGLVLVEMKRFHYPESAPTFKSEGGKPLPPFLEKGTEAPEDRS